MATLEHDGRGSVRISHDVKAAGMSITFTFDKLGDGRVRYRFARSSAGGANADRTDRYDVTDIPQSVFDELEMAGYEHA